MNHHGFGVQFVGLSFIGLAIGELAGGFLSKPIVNILTNWLMRGKNREEESKKPEFHLIPAMLGALLCPIGMFWFAFTGYHSVPWIVPMLAGIPFGWGILLVFSSVWSYLVHAYREWSASAMAANTFLRCTMAGGFPLFAVPVYAQFGMWDEANDGLDVQSLGIWLGWRVACFPLSLDGSSANRFLLLRWNSETKEPICQEVKSCMQGKGTIEGKKDKREKRRSLCDTLQIARDTWTCLHEIHWI